MRAVVMKEMRRRAGVACVLRVCVNTQNLLMSAPAASSVLVTYKRLLTLAKRLPSKEAVKAVADIRAAFRRDKTETDPAKCV